EITQPLDPGADGEGDVAQLRLGVEDVGEHQPVVAGGRFGEQRELAVAPVELPGVDDHASDGGAVSADPLGRRLDDDVGAPVDRPAQVAGGAERVVHHQGDAVAVSDVGEGLEVGDVVLGVADRLHVNGFR